MTLASLHSETIENSVYGIWFFFDVIWFFLFFFFDEKSIARSEKSKFDLI